MEGLIVQREQRTTLEIQLKEKTEGSNEILNMTNLAIVLDQAKALSQLHCPLSSIPAILTRLQGDIALFTLHNTVSSLKDESTTLM